MSCRSFKLSFMPKKLEQMFAADACTPLSAALTCLMRSARNGQGGGGGGGGWGEEGGRAQRRVSVSPGSEVEPYGYCVNASRMSGK